jgi:hypothetical protein
VLWGEHVATSVWKPFLQEVYSQRSWPADWKQPPGIVKISVCADGSRADASTPADKKHDEIFIKGVGEPTTTCAVPEPSASPSPTASPSPVPPH